MDCAWSHSKIDGEQSNLILPANSMTQMQIPSIKLAEVCHQQPAHQYISEGQSEATHQSFWKPPLRSQVAPGNHSLAAGGTSKGAPISRCGSWASHLAAQESLAHGTSHVSQSSHLMDCQQGRTKTPLSSVEEIPAQLPLTSDYTVDRGMPVEPMGTAYKQDNVSPSSPSYFQVANEEHAFHGLPWAENCRDNISQSSWSTATPSPLPMDISRDDTQFVFAHEYFQKGLYDRHCKEETDNFPLGSDGYGAPFLDAYHGAVALCYPGNFEQSSHFPNGANMIERNEEIDGPCMNKQYMCTEIQNWTAVVEDGIELPRFPTLCGDTYSDCSSFSSGVYTQDSTMTASDMELSNDESVIPRPPHHPHVEGNATDLPQPSSSNLKEEEPNREQRPESPKPRLRRRACVGQNSERNITRDAFLVDCKRRGMSYRDIKRIGGFEEAESTLRGRYRTLTKSKEFRVRKPQWQEKDVSSILSIQESMGVNVLIRVVFLR
ncbi:hypothetical protein DTO164E3_5819 [Paecilomyces variotii]|nr:hypothetical protein DTO164E3_5819 [Paecilomyces variotii]KAJ9263667.1 hypothetical protein DTO212C5_7452 [Paecilomyces variotii]